MDEELLSSIITEYGWEDRKYEISELVHDSLAIEHYPTYIMWSQEYSNGIDVFRNMQKNRKKLKKLVGDEYERFIYSHRDI